MTTIYNVYAWNFDPPRLCSANVVKETANFYHLPRSTGLEFHCRVRVTKDQYAATPREAWERYANEQAADIERCKSELANLESCYAVAREELKKLT